MSATRIAFDKINRFASKAPQLEISSSDPVDTATGVAVNKMITLTFSTPLSPETVTSANITMTTSPARTTTLEPSQSQDCYYRPFIKSRWCNFVHSNSDNWSKRHIWALDIDACSNGFDKFHYGLKDKKVKIRYVLYVR